MTRPTLVHFGAGNIGRALVGSLFSQAGWEVIFIDALAAVVDALNEKSQYLVRVKGPLIHGATSDEILVDHVRAIPAQNPEAVAAAIAQADLVSTAVGGNVLPRLFAVLATGIQQRTTPLSIMMCENLHGAAAIVRDGLRKELPANFDFDSRVGLVETSIGKMVPIMPETIRIQDPLEVWGEAYNKIIADGEGFAGPIPEVPGLECKSNFAAYVDRKLYIHNFGHAVAAYRGALAGKKYIWECVADPEVRNHVSIAMLTSGKALIHRYPEEFTIDNQCEHIDDLLARFANQELGDTVFRVGRDLYRKLAPGDRLLGSLRLAEEEEQDPQPIREVIACACRFPAKDENGEPFPGDAEFLSTIAHDGLLSVLQHHCQLDPQKDAAHIHAIELYYKTLD